ncbi:MAG: hypothetical protein IH840_10625 [Candidatus Heimdallarchaeota archaeon]|nr:hypothetical protein [Candidatus Heimdallarchaeota archaeon]
MKVHTFGIECKSCERQWRLELPLTGNIVEVFAAVCDCSAIIVGNFNTKKLRQSKKYQLSIKSEAISLDERYLTNGHFSILDPEQTKLNQLNLLVLE